MKLFNKISLNLLPPAILYQTNNRFPKWEQAKQKMIAVTYREDTPDSAIKHELFHVWQYYMVLVLSFAILSPFIGWYFALLIGLGIHPLLRTVIKPYRFHIEAQAMAWEIRYHSKDKTDDFARALALHYNIKQTREECKQQIRQYSSLFNKIFGRKHA